MDHTALTFLKETEIGSQHLSHASPLILLVHFLPSSGLVGCLPSLSHFQNIDPESDEFTLKHLLDLGLHSFVEDVANIVEKATKVCHLCMCVGACTDALHCNRLFSSAVFFSLVELTENFHSFHMGCLCLRNWGLRRI